MSYALHWNEAGDDRTGSNDRVLTDARRVKHDDAGREPTPRADADRAGTGARPSGRRQVELLRCERTAHDLTVTRDRGFVADPNAGLAHDDAVVADVDASADVDGAALGLDLHIPAEQHALCEIHTLSARAARIDQAVLVDHDTITDENALWMAEDAVSADDDITSHCSKESLQKKSPKQQSQCAGQRKE